MKEGEEAGNKYATTGDDNFAADEIVEATLKAFEKELLNVTEKDKKRRKNQYDSLQQQKILLFQI